MTVVAPIITRNTPNTNNHTCGICNKCDAGVLGDDYHVLFQCNNVEIVRLRSMHIPGYYSPRQSHHKYVVFMQNNSVEVLKDLPLFLRSILCLFRLNDV